MMMYKRLALYWMLFEGYSLASIQRSLGVTHDTTRLYNKRKTQMSEGFKDILHRIGRTVQAATPQEQVSEKREDISVEQPTETAEEQQHKEVLSDEQMAETTGEVAVEETFVADEFIPSVESHEQENDEREEKVAESSTQEEVSEPMSFEIPNEEKAEYKQGESDNVMEDNDENEGKSDEMRMKTSHEEGIENKNTEEEMLENGKENEKEEQLTEYHEEDKDEDDSGGKKKKGFGRFFGF